jgi:hypothetical protein
MTSSINVLRRNKDTVGSSTADWQTKFPTIFHMIFGILHRISTWLYVFIAQFLAESITVFCGTLVAKHWFNL